MIKQTGFYILIFLMLSASGCKQKTPAVHGGEDRENTTEIRGKLQDGATESILLEEMGAREYIPVDTVKCDDSGNFSITFMQKQVAFYVLRYGPSGYVTLLMEPGESVDFKGQLENKDSYSISGSPGSALLQILAAEHKRALDALGEIARKNREFVSAPDYSELKLKWNLQFDSITSVFQDYSIRFIHENVRSPAILIALYNLYGQGIPVFHPSTDFQMYHFVDSALMTNHSELEAVRMLHAQVAEAKLLMESDQQSSLLKNGEIAPDFVSSRPDGSALALSSLRGNLVLLDFWASWSNLSREENATLLKAWEQFGKMNFRILQVSVDDKLTAWTSAIEEDGLVWDHVSELKRWETPVVDLYGVEKVPFNVLIDPSGKIVETDLYGEQLLSKLDQLLNN
ncbi:MAG: TlpA family protein disulfide reductase [Bacteroidales bacterium]|nr:TlpA family protein disulfide reductase [Bacteroidales bacterium]